MEDFIEETKLAEQIQIDEKNLFPLVFKPKENQLKTIDEIDEFIEKFRPEILKLLLKSGAILFRSFPINDALAFDRFARAFKWEALPYIGGAAPRSQVTEIVFTSNESPPSQPIPFHHEMAQVPKFPEHLMFFCEKPSKIGGETPIAFSPMIYEKIRSTLPNFVEKLEEKKVRYTRILPNGDDPNSAIGRGWQSTYMTTDREQAEKICEQQGTEIEWLPDGCLKTMTKILPAVRLDDRTGKKSWFNSIVAAYLGWTDERNDGTRAITFSDGELMNQSDVLICEKILDESSVSFPWAQGDVLLIDNRQVLHARKSFEPPRRILAALFQ